jgi:L-ascorbate 6-phosphate lactonase
MAANPGASFMKPKTKSRSKKTLRKTLDACKVPRGSVALAWLGQAGFVLKSPQGKLLAIDPYLSNSCKAVGAPIGVNMDRLVPVQMEPEDLKGFDALVFSHSHQDHVDPETIKPYLKAGGNGPYIAPHEAANLLIKLGAKAEQISVTWSNNTHQVGDFTLKTTFAIPGGGDDLTHVGYLIDVRGGPRIYFTCDTDYNEVLSLSVAPYQPDIMVTVINPAFRNLSPADAARLAKAIGPKWVIPCHHDLFPDNSLPDRILKTNLMMQGMADAFCPLEHGKIRLFSDKKKRVPLL